MKKMIGLTMMIAALTVGSMTAYAAPVAGAVSCTQNADCPVHDNCPDAGVCGYEGCQYGQADGCYQDHGNHENNQDCEYYRYHNANHVNHEQENHAGRGCRRYDGTGSRHGRGHC